MCTTDLPRTIASRWSKRGDPKKAVDYSFCKFARMLFIIFIYVSSVKGILYKKCINRVSCHCLPWKGRSIRVTGYPCIAQRSLQHWPNWWICRVHWHAEGTHPAMGTRDCSRRLWGLASLPPLHGSATPAYRTVSASGISGLLCLFPTECLDTRLLNFWESLFHRRTLLFQVRKLKMQLEEERQKYSKSDGMNPDIIGLENGSDLQLIEMQSRYMVPVQRYSYWGEETDSSSSFSYTVVQ